MEEKETQTPELFMGHCMHFWTVLRTVRGTPVALLSLMILASAGFAGSQEKHLSELLLKSEHQGKENTKHDVQPRSSSKQGKTGKKRKFFFLSSFSDNLQAICVGEQTKKNSQEKYLKTDL